MGTVSQPLGGHSPAAERKLGKVPHEEKTSVVYVFLAVRTHEEERYEERYEKNGKTGYDECSASVN
jgi:hypothetical protein